MAAATEVEAYAVIAYREQGLWQVELLPSAAADDLDALIAALRQQPGENAAVALVDVADEFFVAVRITAGHVRLLLSDVTAAVDWDLASQVVDHLDLELPDDEDDEVEPLGDLTLFADFGVGEDELGRLLGDLDAYADEMLTSLARRLGFGEAYERVVDALVQ